MLYLLSSLLRAIRFISIEVRGICLALILCFTISAYAEDFCATDSQAEALLPDYGFVADWGFRVDKLYIGENDQNFEIHQRPEIEYEYDERIVYDEEPVTIAKFWQGCESFIGRQQECESDDNITLTLSPDDLNSALNNYGVPINNNLEKIQDLPNQIIEYFVASETPLIEKMFNISMTKSELADRGDFKQLGFRHALRYTWDVNGVVAPLYFENLQMPWRLLYSSGFFINFKTIIKFGFLYPGQDEPTYVANRELLGRSSGYDTLYSADNTVGHFEYLPSDIVDVEYILKNLPYLNEGFNMNYCTKMSLGQIMNGWLLYENQGVDKMILHIETQYSIINSKTVKNFNPKEYMDRDLTLPSKKDAGSLYYLLIGLMMLALKRGSKKLKQRSS